MHIDQNGRAQMIDVSRKPPTRRVARVQCVLRLSREAFRIVQRRRLFKGDPFTVAKIAGIQAAKRTTELIPLCHPLPIEHLDLSFELHARTRTIRVVTVATTTAKTGIEMEAFVAAAIASLTLYDMLKAVDPATSMTDLQLMKKTGGTHEFSREVE